MKRLSLMRTIFELTLLVAVIVLAFRPPSPDLTWRERVVHRVPTKEKLVALTFDDGPHPTFTPEILQILDKYQVKATFFIIGERMEKYPDIAKEVFTRGHVIGNHTYTHPYNIEEETQEQVIWELKKCEQVIERITGKRSYLFRPPRGLVNGKIVRIAEEEGYRVILWTVSADHHDAPTPQLMAERVLKQICPGGIILAHDGRVGIRWKDVVATPIIIKSLIRQGYQFVTIPELLRVGNITKRALSLPILEMPFLFVITAKP